MLTLTTTGLQEGEKNKEKSVACWEVRATASAIDRGEGLKQDVFLWPPSWTTERPKENICVFSNGKKIKRHIRFN